MKHELGASAYRRYSGYIQEQLANNSMEDKQVFQEMIIQLSEYDKSILYAKRERLNKTFLQVFYIRKHFFGRMAAIFALLLAVLFLQPVAPVYHALLFAALSLLVKNLSEYLSHRYCYVDARMILIYKSVLEYLCGSAKEKNVM